MVTAAGIRNVHDIVATIRRHNQNIPDIEPVAAPLNPSEHIRSLGALRIKGGRQFEFNRCVIHRAGIKRTAEIQRLVNHECLRIAGKIEAVGKVVIIAARQFGLLGASKEPVAGYAANHSGSGKPGMGLAADNHADLVRQINHLVEVVLQHHTDADIGFAGAGGAPDLLAAADGAVGDDAVAAGQFQADGDDGGSFLVAANGDGRKCGIGGIGEDGGFRNICVKIQSLGGIHKGLVGHGGILIAEIHEIGEDRRRDVIASIILEERAFGVVFQRFPEDVLEILREETRHGVWRRSGRPFQRLIQITADSFPGIVIAGDARLSGGIGEVDFGEIIEIMIFFFLPAVEDDLAVIGATVEGVEAEEVKQVGPQILVHFQHAVVVEILRRACIVLELQVVRQAKHVIRDPQFLGMEAILNSFLFVISTGVL